MQDLRGKVAVVTGGGSGIGRALALCFASQGMDVVIVDIDETEAEHVANEVRYRGRRALAAACDVSSRDAVHRLAERVYAEFGAVHVLCNNAGVVTFRSAQEMRPSDWDWVIDVNLFGVIHGLEAFLPRMLAQGGEGHIVNTASVAGLFANASPGLIAYTASKFAVVGLSESLAADLEGTGIGVSVLCPGGVRTNIVFAGRNRQEEFGGPEEPNLPNGVELAADPVDLGMDPDEVASRVINAIRGKELYVLTHGETREQVRQRFEGLMAAYDRQHGRR